MSTYIFALFGEKYWRTLPGWPVSGPPDDCFVKYLLEEAHIANNFLKLDDPSIHVQIFEVHLINSLYKVQFFSFHSSGKAIFRKKKETIFDGERNRKNSNFRKALNFI